MWEGYKRGGGIDAAVIRQKSGDEIFEGCVIAGVLSVGGAGFWSQIRHAHVQVILHFETSCASTLNVDLKNLMFNADM